MHKTAQNLLLCSDLDRFRTTVNQIIPDFFELRQTVEFSIVRMTSQNLLFLSVPTSDREIVSYPRTRLKDYNHSWRLMVTLVRQNLNDEDQLRHLHYSWEVFVLELEINKHDFNNLQINSKLAI